MLIDLKTIDENGKDYKFDERSDEIRGAFTDLIGDTPFNIDVAIKPLGNTYQVTGGLSSHYPEVCSKCGHEIDVPLLNRINEIIVIEKQRPRNTQVSQSKQNFDSSGPAVTYVNEYSFNLKEFLHEMMAASFDLYPKCGDVEKCEKQQAVQKAVAAAKLSTGHPSFEALKNFKPKN